LHPSESSNRPTLADVSDLGVSFLVKEQDVEAGIGAVDYLRRQRSVQHLPDRGEVESAKAQQGGVGTGGYVSTFITKAQVRVQ
jgi:hypothetical protein